MEEEGGFGMAAGVFSGERWEGFLGVFFVLFSGFGRGGG